MASSDLVYCKFRNNDVKWKHVNLRIGHLCPKNHVENEGNILLKVPSCCIISIKRISHLLIRVKKTKTIVDFFVIWQAQKLDSETYSITIYCTRENQVSGTDVPAAVK